MRDPAFGIQFFLVANHPMLIAWLAGILLVVKNRRRHPKVCLLTAIALGIFIGLFVEGHLGLTFRLMRSYDSVTAVGIQVLRNVVNAIGWFLLLAAIFGWRRESQNAMARMDSKGSPGPASP